MSGKNGGGGGFSIIEEKAIPDTYADSTTFEVSLYGVTIEFGQSRRPAPGSSGRPPHIPRVRVHMSVQHAKVIAKLLVKNMQEYEKQVGPVVLPEALYKELGISEEW